MAGSGEDRLVALAGELVRTPSPTGEVSAALTLVESFLRQARVPTDRFDPGVEGAAVLVAGRPPATGRPTFLLATHLDTVSTLAPPSRLAGTVEGERLYGRGSLDMKAGLALALLLLWEFSEDPRFNLGFVATTDEEAESAGAWALLDRLPVPPDLVLVPEPSWERVGLSARGRAVWEVTFQGQGGHGQGLRPGRARGATQGGARPVNPLQAMTRFLGTLPGGYNPLRLWTEGEGELTVPRAVHARIDRLLPPGTPREEDRRGLERRALAEARRGRGLAARVVASLRRTPWLEGYRTDPANPWVRRFVAGARTETGRAIPVGPIEAVGDFNVLGARYPTLVFGPGGEGAHADDEWVDLPSLLRCYRAYRRFLLGIGSAEPPTKAAAGRRRAPKTRGPNRGRGRRPDKS